MSGMVLPLTRGYFAIVDKEDLERCLKYKWQVQKIGTVIYAGTAIRKSNGFRSRMYLHKFIMKDFDQQGMTIDHINHNGLDNRRKNLRIATYSQNQLNKRSTKKTSIYKGVTKRKGNGRVWSASIKMPNGKYKCIGWFHTEIEAAKAYNEFARQCYGDAIYINNLD